MLYCIRLNTEAGTRDGVRVVLTVMRERDIEGVPALPGVLNLFSSKQGAYAPLLCCVKALQAKGMTPRANARGHGFSYIPLAVHDIEYR